MTKSKAQVWVALFLIGLWAVGIVVAAVDGNTMVRVMTPIMTLAMGWLFADKASKS